MNTLGNSLKSNAAKNAASTRTMQTLIAALHHATDIVENPRPELVALNHALVDASISLEMPENQGDDILSEGFDLYEILIARNS